MSAARKLLPTIILAVLAVAGFFYAKSEDFFRKAEEQPDKLTAIAADDVTAFTMKLADGEELALEKRDGAWTMSKPSAIPVDESAVASWLASFGELPFDKPIDDNPQDLGKYALGDSAEMYEVKLADGTTRGVLVGDTLPTASSRYVKLADGAAVYAVSDSTLQSLYRTQLDFMNNSAIDTEYAKLKSVKYSWNGAAYEMTKADADKATYESDWSVNGTTVKGADIDAAFVKLLFLKTDQLAKPAADVSLAQPELTVEFVTANGGQEKRQTYVGKQDGDNVWVSEQAGQWAYAVAASELQAVTDATEQALTPPEPEAAAAPEAAPSPEATAGAGGGQ